MKKEKKTLLPLTNDLVFHAVYGRDTKESKQALIALLNAILDRKDDPITDIAYLNPVSYPANAEGKTPVLDIRVLTEAQELIDVELQVTVRPLYRNRPIFYGARMIADDLEKGEDYGKIATGQLFYTFCARADAMRGFYHDGLRPVVVK